VWFRRHASTERSSFHVTAMPSGVAATLTAEVDGPNVDVSWHLDPGIVATAREQLIVEQAARELRAALADPPAEGATARPTWMGSFLWVPPLRD
jgi:hypothetical protein